MATRNLTCGCVVTPTGVQMCPEMVRLDAIYKLDPAYPHGAHCREHLVGGVARMLVAFDFQLTDTPGVYHIPPFEAFTNGRTWNGWACPMFEKAEADRLVEVLRADPYWDGDHRYDPEQDAYVLGCGDGDEEDIWPSSEFEGHHVYAIGAGSWCWNDLTDEQYAEEDQDDD